jgi:hypothetical protein
LCGKTAAVYPWSSRVSPIGFYFATLGRETVTVGVGRCLRAFQVRLIVAIAKYFLEVLYSTG